MWSSVCVCVCEGVNRNEWAAIQATLHICQVHPVLIVTTHNMDTHTHTHTHTHTNIIESKQLHFYDNVVKCCAV